MIGTFQRPLDNGCLRDLSIGSGDTLEKYSKTINLPVLSSS